jgi:hypothetical protein
LWGLLIRAAALVGVLLLAGCGGGGADGEGDPATAVPADALFYAEAVVRPEGSLREDAEDAASKVLGTDDPGGRIREWITQAYEEETGEDIDWDRDVEPWLGNRIAFWAIPSGTGRFGVALLAVKDADAARESLRTRLEADGSTVSERSHRGTDYFLDADGVAVGIVGDFVAAGRERDVVATIDAHEGDSLAETSAYADAVDDLADERLAHFWADVPGLFELARRQVPELEQLGSLVPVGDLPVAAGAFLANGDRLALEIEARGNKDLGLDASGTPLLQELPGDAWAAAGSADVGETLRDALDRFGGPLGGVAVRGLLRRELGLDLDRDLLDWIGDAGFFVRGTSPGAIDGGLVIQPTDEERAADAFGRIVGAVQQERGAAARPVGIAGADQAFAIEDRAAGREIVLARGSGLVVATAGAAAAEAALGSGDRLGDTDAYAEAQELVGMTPSLVVSVPQLLELAGPKMRRHLEPFTVLAAGGTRLAAGLR